MNFGRGSVVYVTPNFLRPLHRELTPVPVYSDKMTTEATTGIQEEPNFFFVMNIANISIVRP
jgi:hypothetical protein